MIKKKRVKIQFKTAIIETTTHCNLQCPYCARRFDMIEEKNMLLDEFDQILRQLVHAKKYFIGRVLALSGFGEPLMNPHFIEMINNPLLKKFKYVTFSTNATLLTEENIKQLIDAQSIWLINVSLQSSKKQVMRSLQRGARFQKTVTNIKSLIRYAYGKKTKVRIQYLLTTKNLGETQADFEKLLGRKLNVKNILFWKKRLTPGTIGNKLLESPEFQNFHKLLPKPFHRPDPDKPFQCKGIYAPNLVINVHGDLTPCCHDSTRLQTYGNIFDTPLIKLRSSKLLRELRTELKNKNFNRLPLCERCLSLR